MHTEAQLPLFSDQNLNILYEVKRQIRLALSTSTLSRDQAADEMNRLAARDNINIKATRDTLDGWCKDSCPERMPSCAALTLFCCVLHTIAPIRAMLQVLGADVMSAEDAALLAWAKAERDRRRAAKKARLAMESLES